VVQDKSLRSLQHAVRLRVMARHGGRLAVTVAMLNTVPLVAMLLDGSYRGATSLAVTTGLVGAAGWFCRRIEAPEEIQPNEALVLVAAAFILTPLLLTWPLYCLGLAPVDAWFEAVSGVTTTGLSTVSHPEQVPRALLFTRAWLQWYGGLGFAVLCVALLVPRGLAARRLLEPTGARESDIPSMTGHARQLAMVYGALTLAGWLALWAAEADPFAALVHTLSAVSTGGFSSFQASLGGFAHPISPWVLSLTTLLAAVSLPLYLYAARRQWRQVLGDGELHALLLLTLAVAAALALILLLAGAGPGYALRHGLLLGISAQTTSGFSSLDPATLPAAAKWVTILSMTVGGSVGSTAGGIKVLRLLILLRVIQLLIRRMGLPPHAVTQARLNGRTLETHEVLQLLGVPTLFLLVVMISVVPFLHHGYLPLDALFEVVSATGTVGLSTGVTSSALPAALKVVLALDMLAGRLEFIALLVFLSPHTWFGRRYATT